MSGHLIFETLEEAERVIPQGTIRKIQLEGHQYCLAHTVKGWYAFEKECPHLSEDLSKASLNSIPEVICPWHAYSFDLKTGQEYRDRCKSLRVYRTEWSEEGLLVFIDT